MTTGSGKHNMFAVYCIILDHAVIYVPDFFKITLLCFVPPDSGVAVETCKHSMIDGGLQQTWLLIIMKKAFHTVLRIANPSFHRHTRNTQVHIHTHKLL